MKFLCVKNWDQFQQYKDRDPKWIKLHRDVLDDYEFDSLNEIQQLHLLKIWLLAAKLGNKIPNDAEWVGRKIGARSKVDLKQLVTNGFLYPYRSVQDRTEAYPEEEVEEETETETEVVAAETAPLPQPQARFRIPMTGGRSHPITDEDLARYRELYPAVNIEQSIRNQIGWLEANPKRRSGTAQGVKSRMTTWLASDQDKAGRKPQAGSSDNARSALIEEASRLRAVR